MCVWVGRQRETLETACFYKTNVDKADLNKHKVRLDWKTGIAVADWEKIAKADNVDKISGTLRSLEARVSSTPSNRSRALDLE